MESKKRYSMFHPKTKHGLLVDYPELKQYDEFKNVTPKELLFVWYYSNKSSPFYKIDDDRKRSYAAYNHVFKDSDAKRASKYLNLQFPDSVKLAIVRMSSFELTPRIRAKLMIDDIISKFENMIDVDVTNDTQFLNADGLVDWSKKKAFIDACANISKTLPGLIEQAEKSFAISEITSSNDDDDFDESLHIESYVSQKQEG